MEKIGDILPVLQRAYTLGLADKNIYELLKISAGTWGRVKHGLDPMHGQDWLNCKNLVLDCEELQRRAVAPIDWSNLRAIRTQLEMLREERKNPPEPPSHRDWELMSLISDRSITPTAIAANLGISLDELHEHFAGAIKRVEYATNKLGAWNADRTRLNDENLAAVDASEAKRNR